MHAVRRAAARRAGHWLNRVVDVEPREVGGLAWAFVYHFCLLCSYYLLRPIRDEMGIAGGVDQLQWLFLATFLAMVALVPLFGWLTSRVPRRRFLPYAYLFFVANIVGFFALFRSGLTHAHVARVFFVWVSVFNLFVVSVFWSFMTDIFDDAQSKRLFGVIAAGGSAGALVGPAIAGGLAPVIGVTNLLLISAAFLALVLLCVQKLSAWDSVARGERSSEAAPAAQTNREARARGATGRRLRGGDQDGRLAGSIWAGVTLVLRSRYLLGICVLMLLYTTLSTFLYFQQAHIVEAAFEDSADRTQVFAGIDFAVNALTLVLQTFLTGRIVRLLGLPWALALVPLFLVIGFGALAAAPLLIVFVAVQVLRRAGNYALMKPTREMLYVVLSREEKYKAKNFIDTAVYRSGDAISAWIFHGMRALGLTLAQTALVAVPLAGVWAWVAFRLGKRRNRLVGPAGPDDTRKTEATTSERRLAT